MLHGSGSSTLSDNEFVFPDSTCTGSSYSEGSSSTDLVGMLGKCLSSGSHSICECDGECVSNVKVQSSDLPSLYGDSSLRADVLRSFFCGGYGIGRDAIDSSSILDELGLSDMGSENCESPEGCIAEVGNYAGKVEGSISEIGPDLSVGIESRDDCTFVSLGCGSPSSDSIPADSAFYTTRESDAVTFGGAVRCGGAAARGGSSGGATRAGGRLLLGSSVNRSYDTRRYQRNMVIVRRSTILESCRCYFSTDEVIGIGVALLLISVIVFLCALEEKYCLVIAPIIMGAGVAVLSLGCYDMSQRAARTSARRGMV